MSELDEGADALASLEVYDSLVLARNTTIGDDSAFGSVAAVVPIGNPADRIAVLDGMNGRVRLYDSGGTLLAQYGRPGGGPNELRFPRDLELDTAGQLLVLDRGNKRIATLRIYDAGLELVDTRPLPFDVSDFCTADGRLFVLGLHNHRYVHEMRQNDGAVLNSFDVEASEDPMRAAVTAMGRLACSSAHIALVASTARDAWLFDLNGQTVGQYEVPDYSETVYQTDGVSFRPTLPSAGFAHSTEAVTWLADTHLLVQLRRMPGGEALEGRVLSLDDGWTDWRPAWPKVLARGGKRIYAYAEVPYPVVEVNHVR